MDNFPSANISITLDIEQMQALKEMDDRFVLIPYEAMLIQQERCLELMWGHARHEKALGSIFWWMPENDQQRLDKWMEYFRKALTLVVYDKETPEFAGLVWFYNIEPGSTAHMGIWYRRRYWGETTREITRKAVQWIGYAQGIEYVFACTISSAAKRHGMAVGRCVAEIENYIKRGGKYRTMYVLMSEPELL